MTSTTLDEQRQALYEVAERIAPTWVLRRDFVESIARPVRDWLLDALDPQPGETFLEVAAGLGETGFAAAEKLGDKGRLISTDLSPTLVEAASKRGAEFGLTNVEYRAADAGDTGLDADSVDGVLCRFGYMLMADRPGALAEARRVLKDEGRLALAVFGAPERNPFFTALAMTLVGRGTIPPPDPNAPGIFSMADPDGLRKLLESSGFKTVQIDEVPMTFRVPDTEQYVAIVADTAGQLGVALQSLSDSERGEVAAQLRDTVTRFETSDGYELPGVALCALAR